MAGGDPIGCLTSQFYDPAQPVGPRLVEHELESCTDEIRCEQNHKHSDPQSLIDRPVDERDDDQVKLDLAQKCEKAHHAVQSGTELLQGQDKGKIVKLNSKRTRPSGPRPLLEL